VRRGGGGGGSGRKRNSTRESFRTDSLFRREETNAICSLFLLFDPSPSSLFLTSSDEDEDELNELNFGQLERLMWRGGEGGMEYMVRRSSTSVCSLCYLSSSSWDRIHYRRGIGVSSLFIMIIRLRNPLTIRGKGKSEILVQSISRHQVARERETNPVRNLNLAG